VIFEIGVGRIRDRDG